MALTPEERAELQADVADERERKRLASKRHYASLTPEEKKERQTTKYQREYAAEWQKQRRMQMPEHVREVDRESRRKQKEKKAGRSKPETCEVCGRYGRIVWDHCHLSETFRGWICQPCNTVLGLVSDNPVLLEKLALYVRTHVETK
jgi:hypothetical protein